MTSSFSHYFERFKSYFLILDKLGWYHNSAIVNGNIYFAKFKLASHALLLLVTTHTIYLTLYIKLASHFSPYCLLILVNKLDLRASLLLLDRKFERLITLFIFLLRV